MKKRHGFLQRGLLGITALATAMVVSMTGAVSADNEPTVPDGIRISDIEIAGMTEEQLKETVEQRIQEIGKTMLTIDAPSRDVTVSLAELGLYWSNQEEVYGVVFASNNTGSLITQYKQRKDLENSNLTLSIETKVDKDLLANLLLDNLENLNSEAENATVERIGGQFVVTDGVVGMTMDVDATYNEIAAAILNVDDTFQESSELVVAVVGEEIEPAIMADAYENFGDLLGEWTTTYSTLDEGRTVNVTLATNKFNGTVIMPGEVLSALEVMGPVTADGGYEAAGTYTPGGVEDQIGGGICQVATTLYNAALWAELEIPLRRNHSRIVAYVPYAMDAMVYAKGNSDFKIKNNTEYPIYIESFVDNSKKQGSMTFRIYGVETRPDNRVIDYESKIISASVPGEDADPSEYYTLVYDETMPKFGENEHEADYAIEQSSFYPLVKAELYKVVYVDGVEVSRTKINTSNYTNSRTNRIITGVFEVNPDTYIKSIEYDVETREMMIIWGSYEKDAETSSDESTEDTSSEGTSQESTEQSTETPTEPSTEPSTELPTEPSTAVPDVPTETPTEPQVDPSTQPETPPQQETEAPSEQPSGGDI